MAVAAVAAAALVAIGVGGSSNPATPAATIADAATATASEPGFHIALQGEVSVSGQAPLTVRGSGVMNGRSKRGALTIHVPPGPGLPKGMNMDEVFADFVLYMRSPLFKRSLGDGKSWIRIDLRRATRSFGFDVSQLGSGSDPTRELDQLRATSGEVRRLGTARIRGVQTTHYRATVDMRRYPRLVPPARRAAARRAAEQLVRLSGVATFPEDVWVDRRGRIRRCRVAYSMRAPGAPGGQKVATTLTQDFFGFGTPVHVQVPAADETKDVTAATSAAMRRQRPPAAP